jgi:hypothetical protein
VILERTLWPSVFLFIFLGGCSLEGRFPSEDPCARDVAHLADPDGFIECLDGCFLFDADGDTRVDDRVCKDTNTGCTTLDLHNNGDIDTKKCVGPSGCSLVDADNDGEKDDSFCVKVQGCFTIDLDSNGSLDENNCPGCNDWQLFDFSLSPEVENACSGERFVTFHSGYQKFIGVILCSPTIYKIVMGSSLSSPFFNIGDTAGGGQDHCELVNPDFSIPNEDDITSGGCSLCDLGPSDSVKGGAGFIRAKFGEDFAFDNKWIPNYITPSFYECGIALPVIDEGCAPDPSCVFIDRDTNGTTDTFDCTDINGCVGSDFNNDGIIDAAVCDPGQSP